jgi:hypothetical protein
VHEGREQSKQCKQDQRINRVSHGTSPPGNRQPQRRSLGLPTGGQGGGVDRPFGTCAAQLLARSFSSKKARASMA